MVPLVKSCGTRITFQLSRSNGENARCCLNESSVLLLERSLKEPHRIVGVLMQPGGVDALKKLGLGECLYQWLVVLRVTFEPPKSY